LKKIVFTHVFSITQTRVNSFDTSNQITSRLILQLSAPAFTRRRACRAKVKQLIH